MTTGSGKPSIDPSIWLDCFGDSFYAYVYSRLHDAGAAEDVVQETFLAGIKHRDSYRGESPEKSWLMTILRRKIVDYVRSRDRHDKRRADEQEMESCPVVTNCDGVWRIDPSDSTADPECVASFHELWDRLHACLDQLPESQRDAFVLRELEDLSADEICRTMTISTANLWVRLHRARMKLAECIGLVWVDDEEAKDHVR